MKQAAEIDRDVFYSGVYRVLCSMLIRADADEDYRAAVAQIGRDLRTDGNWRAMLKLSDGWDGHASAWEALSAFIKKNGGDGEWWKVLAFASGEEVSLFI